MKPIYLLLCMLSFIIVACTAQSEATPTVARAFVVRELPTPTYTPRPTATFTPSPTSTPTLTPTSTPTPTSTLTPDPGPERIEIGLSINRNSIEATRFGFGPNVILLIGGLHAGFAPNSVTIAQQFITHFSNHLQEIPTSVTLYIIPNANPDSVNAPGELAGRLNANNVDLNRNWECRWTKDAQWRGEVIRDSGGVSAFSEPETVALRDFILNIGADAVIIWEARVIGGLVSPGNCASRHTPSETLALAYGEAVEYPIADFERLTDQVLNGDSTNWLAQQNIAAIAVLFTDYETIDWANNLSGVQAVLALYAE